MNPVAQYAARLGDDALVLGQRLCEWSSRAPLLEEDLALSNTALDYLGRARMLYGYAGELTGCSEDDYAFLRESREFQNLLMVELPRGDHRHRPTRRLLPLVRRGGPDPELHEVDHALRLERPSER